MKRQFALFLLACGLSATTCAATPAPDKPGSLERAFRQCMKLSSNPLTNDLIRTIWADEPSAARAAYEARHAQRIRPGSLQLQVGDNPDQPIVRVELRGAERIAGVVPRAVTASTCVSGCGLAVWTVEFGPLDLASKIRLLSWAHRAPELSYDGIPGTVKPRFYETLDGSITLMCDIST